MKEEQRRSKFSAKMLEIAQEATMMASKQDGRSVIIISTDTEDDGTGTVIAFAGCPDGLAKGIASFATRDESKDLFIHGLELAQKKIVVNAVETMFGELLKK